MVGAFELKNPSVEGLPPPLAKAARGIAKRLAERGRRAWIAGGAVRDLALSRSPKDVDMVSAAPPEEVEAAFERTIPVGRAFGTVVVLCGDVEVQLTTFRSESGYTDARRPDEVLYSSSVEEDATRRDFTCNALYLDPLTDEVRDPEGGLPDLARGVLRTVGDPHLRFREDGLRLLRMARFQASLDLRPAEGLLEAARAERQSLRGVSAERVLEELTRILDGPRGAAALLLLDQCDLLSGALPGWRERASGSRPWRLVQDARHRALAALPDPLGHVLGWAALLECDPLGPGGEAALKAGLELVEALHASRALRATLSALWRGRRELERLAHGNADLGERALALRDDDAPNALQLARAWSHALTDDARVRALDELATWRAARTRDELFPTPWIASADLAAARVPRGPLWGELLSEAERLQLGGRFADRAGALAWLEGRVRTS